MSNSRQSLCALLPLAMLFCGALVGCKSKEQAPASGASAASAATSTPSPAASAASTSAAGSGKCPAGRWKYDYSDQALEVIMKGAAGAKVIKEEGEFFCDVSEGSEGTIRCATQGKPVVNVVETKQAGFPMTISVTIDGSATTKFKIVDSGRMTVVSSDVSGLKVTTNVTLAGKEVPFPTDKLLTLFGNPESTLSYKCESGKLLIKPDVHGVQNTWQELTPAG